jgi:hypothetical protein
MRESIRRASVVSLLALFATTVALAQPDKSAGGAHKSAARPLPPVDLQVMAATFALPEDLRDSATVLGYRGADTLELIRAGSNGMICLALFAITKDFHVACYQDAIEPFMARGRALRRQGLDAAQTDTVRFAEVRSGKIKMPASAVMYQLFGGPDAFDPVTGKVTGVSQLMVVYMPYATAKSSGLSTKPSDKTPYLMYPGTPKAHMMVMGLMNPN